MRDRTCFQLALPTGAQWARTNRATEMLHATLDRGYPARALCGVANLSPAAAEAWHRACPRCRARLRTADATSPVP